jgi:hypothetical protein
MDIPFEIPLDSDGYVRRQCPRCERHFKWPPDDKGDDHNEETREVAAQSIIYYCPYCGEESASDQWWTDEQVDFAQGLAAIEMMRLVEQNLGPSVDRINRSGGIVKMDIDVPTVTPPPPLIELNDMIAVEPPCHPEEPIKILDGWNEEIHCIVCGRRFVVE